MGSINLEKWCVIATILMLVRFFKVSEGGVHTVGDLAGWTIKGNVDYKQWAVNKTFQPGDTIVFNYNPQFHNVMVVVTHAEYRACNVSSPISTYTSGNDSITIRTHGHHFFVCGVPGHCQAGQKVDINVRRAQSPSVGPPSPIASSPTPTVGVPGPASGAPTVVNFQNFGCLLLLCVESVLFSLVW